MLVKYESISKNPIIWAKTIENTCLQNRKYNKKFIFNKISESGYDIVREAKVLKKFYLKLYEKNTGL